MSDSGRAATVSFKMQSIDGKNTPAVTWSVDDNDTTLCLTVKVPYGTSIELKAVNPPVVEK